MTVVALVNQKGGVGKTTITLGLAAAGGARGLRVLVVDLDPQANATSGLGLSSPPRTIDEALATGRSRSVVDVAVRSAWPDDVLKAPDVAAGTPLLAGREIQLATDPIGAQDRLATALDNTSWDLVLIDCPPSLGLLTINGLFAADRAVIVTEAAAWAVDGVAQMRHTIERVGARRQRRLDLAGIVVNRMGRTRDGAYWLDQLGREYPGLVQGPVRSRAAVAEASAQSLPLQATPRRSGAPRALAELDLLFDRLIGSDLR